MTEGTLESIYSGAKTVLGTWGEAFDGGLLTDMDTDDIKCVWMPPPPPNTTFAGWSKKVTEDILNFKLSLLPLHEHFNYTACLSFYKFKEIL